MNIIHPSMTRVWDPLKEVEKSKQLSGQELLEWLDNQGKLWVRDADKDVRPFVRLLQIMKECDHYRSAGIEDWSRLCAFLNVRPDLADQLMEGVRLLGWDKPIPQDLAARTVARMREAEKAKGVGKPVGSNVDVVNIRETGGGNSTTYLAARLKRDAPQIAEAVERGEYKSMRSAAIDAGIIKISRYREMCNSWKKASEEERHQFENFIANFRRSQHD